MVRRGQDANFGEAHGRGPTCVAMARAVMADRKHEAAESPQSRSRCQLPSKSGDTPCEPGAANSPKSQRPSWANDANEGKSGKIWKSRVILPRPPPSLMFLDSQIGTGQKAPQRSCDCGCRDLRPCLRLSASNPRNQRAICLMRLFPIVERSARSPSADRPRVSGQ